MSDNWNPLADYPYECPICCREIDGITNGEHAACYEPAMSNHPKFTQGTDSASDDTGETMAKEIRRN